MDILEVWALVLGFGHWFRGLGQLWSWSALEVRLGSVGQWFRRSGQCWAVVWKVLAVLGSRLEPFGSSLGGLGSGFLGLGSDGQWFRKSGQ